MYSMMEAEIIAVLEGFKAIARLEDRTGRKVANKIAIYIDNLEGQRLIAAIMAEPLGSPLLESMSLNLPRITQCEVNQRGSKQIPLGHLLLDSRSHKKQFVHCTW